MYPDLFCKIYKVLIFIHTMINCPLVAGNNDCLIKLDFSTTEVTNKKHCRYLQTQLGVPRNNPGQSTTVVRRSEIHFFQHLNKASPDYCAQAAI